MALECDTHGWSCSPSCCGSGGLDAREAVRIGAAGVLLGAALAAEHFALSLPIPVAVLSLGSLVLTGLPIIVGTVQGLLQRQRNVGELASIAIVAALYLGEFTVAAELGFIMALGEVAEEYAHRRSRRDIEAIAADTPRYAFVVRDGETVRAALSEIGPGDRVLVRPGDVVPVDGTVATGTSAVDESHLTGESIPVEKGPGDAVYAGTINHDGALQVTVLRVGDRSAYGKIMQMVREAEERRPPSRPLVDRLAVVYTPVMLAAAGVVLLATGDLQRSISLLIVACPCALLLATPSAVLAAIGAGARRGVLIRGGEYLEACSKIDTVVFDKTGTLTLGDLHVTKVVPFCGRTVEGVLRVAAVAEAGSEHPVARAILDAAPEPGSHAADATEMHLHPGGGIEARSGEARIVVGSARLLALTGIPLPEEARAVRDTLAASGVTPVFVAVDEEVVGVIGLQDRLRPESVEVIERLRREGIETIAMLTGDHEVVARRVAAEAGILEDAVYAGLLPGQKQEYVETLQTGDRTVCFVGDGTNDGPALARADIGVSIGSREDTVALETSHVVLMRGGLAELPDFLRLGKRAARTITANVLFALAFSFSMIALAALGILSPAGGAIAHQAGTLIVLANSASLAGRAFVDLPGGRFGRHGPGSCPAADGL
ncbi:MULTISPECIES: cation-translocating P-type ATPase [unclassified Methanoculleus]|jgi:Cd2+/Zn2+-exporting ATPase|uniref:heavy metal translocating P-type ATPase n=1 Tax=unclassified Methanoculleus TaxID=2619537 RepID=UPI00319DB791